MIKKSHVISLYIIISLILAGIFGMASLFFYKNILQTDSSHGDTTTIARLEEIVQNTDILNASLLLAKEYCEDIDIEQANKTFDKIANEIEVRIKNTDNPKEIINVINDYLFVEYQIQPVAAISIDNLLPDKVLENRKGHCVGLSLLYLALGERLHLPIFGKVVPSHIYICYDNGFTKLNIETTLKGHICPDSYYFYHFPCPEKHQTIRKLNKREMLGLFLNNLGYYMRQSTKVLDIRKKALMLFPDCEQIHTNMGSILLKLNERKKAKSHLLKAIELDSTSWQASFLIANLYYEDGDYKQATEFYVKSINLLHKSVKILSSAISTNRITCLK